MTSDNKLMDLKRELDRSVMEADKGQLMVLSILMQRVTDLEERVTKIETRQTPETYLDQA